MKKENVDACLEKIFFVTIYIIFLSHQVSHLLSFSSSYFSNHKVFLSSFFLLFQTLHIISPIYEVLVLFEEYSFDSCGNGWLNGIFALAFATQVMLFSLH